MNKNLTELVFILDRSGSMAGLESDTVGGFNSFLAKQKQQDGKCLVSTVLFNQKSSVIHDRQDLDKIRDMKKEDYFPSGMTALLDALGDGIRHIRMVHKYIREEDVPSQTIFVIITDGLENASRKYSSDEVKKMVSEQKEKGWQFLFLGANIDAVETAKHYGIDEDYSVDFKCDGMGVSTNFGCLADTISDARAYGKVKKSWSNKIREDVQKRGK